ncbi:MAG: S-layer homology domain-containing protein [Oscillospiraceae bacterium]|nr:S-layer homology domain-containing protein [Oscillospiraceae bacterium]
MKKKLCRIVPLVLITVLLLSNWAYATGKPHEIRESAQMPIVEFEDVSPDDRFYRSVLTGIRLGIIQGVSEENFRFEPERVITRAEYISMLGRMHEYFNEPIGTPREGLFYERYLVWAVEAGIIRGNEHGDLMSHEFLTREQMIVIANRHLAAFGLWRTVVSNFWSSIPVGMFLLDITMHNDTDISYWAQDSVDAFGSIHLLPVDNLYFRPQDIATRAEALSFITSVSRWLIE